MNHNVFGKKLSRTKNERKRLFSNLVRSFILHGSIVTSRAKAKAVQPLMEQLVTKAKKGKDVDRRLILKTITDGAVVNMLLADAKDRFLKRTSGYTRMVKIGNIRSDGSEEVMLSFVDEAVKREPVFYPKKEKKIRSPKTVADTLENEKEGEKVKKTVQSKKK